MNCNSKIRLLSSEKLGIRSSIEAFIASKITVDWQPCKELFQAVSGAVSKDQFENTIEYFIEMEAVEKESGRSTVLEFNEGADFRDYTGINFNSDELKEAPELPINFKKEMLFLYYYGSNINYYKVLNLNAETGESFQKISEKCNFYRMITAGRHFEGIELGTYKTKIEKVRTIIKTACQIEEINAREDYDSSLKSQSKSDATISLEKPAKTPLKSAEEHFILAIRYNHEKDLKKALNEVLIASQLNPECSDYLDLKKELTEKLKSERTSILFKALESNDSLLLDEAKLEKVISGIVELTESSPLAHLRLAKIALEKDMPEMAVQHAYEAVEKDPDLKNEVEDIIRMANRKMKELYMLPDEQKTYQINNKDSGRKK
ncbi:MAG TPA: hypothetical protein PKG52_07370 [bacterium]|nr:hypothetical protein [bacterium]HPS30500.1 hypothetical protein [bacterium]